MDFEPYDGYFWQGKKVRLRPMQIEDADKKLREYTDSEARAWLQLGMELPPVSREAYIEQINPYLDFKDISQHLSFSIETLDGEYVGWINLHSKNGRRGTFSFGISIFREYQRNGYAEEAVRIVMRYGFNELRMQKCNSACIAISMQVRSGYTRNSVSSRKAVFDVTFTSMGNSTMTWCGDC